MKTPDTFSAVDTATSLRRKLKAAGFTLSKPLTYNKFSVGVSVHRLGVSNLVVIDYRAPWYGRSDRGTPEERTERDETIRRVREWLAANNYPLAGPERYNGLAVLCTMS